jgi:hypothetical protein
LFETFCEDAPRNKLRGNTNFVFFGPMDQKLWMFEVLGEVRAAKKLFIFKFFWVGFFFVDS